YRLEKARHRTLCLYAPYAAMPLLSQPSRRHAHPPRVVAELRVGAFGARDLQIGVWDLLDHHLQLRRVVAELRRAVAEGEEAGDVGAERFDARDQKIAILARLPNL